MRPVDLTSRRGRADPGYLPVPALQLGLTSPYLLTESSTSSPHESHMNDNPLESPQAKPIHSPPPTIAPIRFLDGLRGLAALLVVTRHAGYIEAYDVGAPAVDAFFMLSAFLLTLIYEKTARQLFRRQASYREWKWVLVDYFMRRFLRVYPLFALVACILAVLTFQFDYQYHVFWTLAVEIGYYLLLPVVVVVSIKLRRHWWWVLGVPLYALLFASGFFFHRTRHQPLWMHLPTFLCGSLAVIVYSKLQLVITQRGIELNRWHWLAIRSVETVFIGVMLSVVFDGLFFHWIIANPLPQQSSGTRFTSFHVTVILVGELLIPGGAVASLLESPPLLYAGKVSYSMYLFHSFVVYAPWIQRMPYYDRVFATWGLVFALSALSHVMIEAPCQRLAARLGQYIKQRSSDDGAARGPAPPLPV